MDSRLNIAPIATFLPKVQITQLLRGTEKCRHTQSVAHSGYARARQNQDQQLSVTTCTGTS
jgi:hypothetical protein